MSELKKIEKLPGRNNSEGSVLKDMDYFNDMCNKINEIAERYNEDAEAILRYVTVTGKKMEEFYTRLIELTELVVPKGQDGKK